MTSVDDVHLPDLVREQQAELERLQRGARAVACSLCRERASATSRSPTPQGDVEPLYTLLDIADLDPAATPAAGRVPVHARHSPDGLSRTAVDQAPVRRVSARAAETNKRFKFLLEHGQTGLSTAFDFPTLMGYDSDHPRSEGEVGKSGVAISSLADMETLFDGIPLDKVSTSMTINGPAVILFCFYVAAAEKQGVSPNAIRGTVQNDILKEYMAQHAWVYPIEPALRLIVDLFEWGAEHAPLWNTISISGYHIREAGATAVQELAFTLANGFTYVERGVARGLDVDSFARRALVLLRHPQRLLRGDRQAARRASHLGAAHARALRRQGSALVDAALPLADRGRHAHGAAADEQHRARGVPGAGRGARRHAVAAHQLDGRDARASDRGGGAGRAAHAAGPRVRDRRAERDRPARRLVLRRGAHRPDGARGRGDLRGDRRRRRRGAGDRAGVVPAQDRRVGRAAAVGDRAAPPA